MVPIVAIRVVLDDDAAVFLLTWGGIPEYADRLSLENAARRYVARHGDLAGRVTDLSVCQHVRDAVEAPYFFESFFEMAQKQQPRHPWLRAVWHRRIAHRISEGREIWFLGLPPGRGSRLPDG